MPVIHMNDYPATPPRAEINRPVPRLPRRRRRPAEGGLRTLHANGFRGFLSLELFNHEYWKNDALLVARTGLEKMKAVAHAAVEEKP